MKKNRIIAAIWMSLIALIIVAMVSYVIYADKNNPYFGNKTEQSTTNVVAFTQNQSEVSHEVF